MLKNFFSSAFSYFLLKKQEIYEYKNSLYSYKEKLIHMKKIDKLIIVFAIEFLAATLILTSVTFY